MLAFIVSFLLSCSKLDVNNTKDEVIPTNNTSNLKAAINPTANADATYDGFVRAFVVRSGSRTYITNGLNDRGTAYMWGQGFMITAMEDAYDRNQSASRKQLVVDLLNTFITDNGSDWSWDSWNDDIAWACIPFIRGYQITGDTKYRDIAANNWNMMYNRAWDNTVGGGLWENQDKQTKNALSTNPNIIAGIFIYQSTGDAGYLTKCRAIYAWVKGHLLDNNDKHINGAVTASGVLQTSDNAYDDGSFVNAGASLYHVTGEVGYLNEAVATANHIVSKWPLMTQEADAAVRAIGKLAREDNLGSTYYSWLANNCASAWNHRRTDYNITNNNWTVNTGAGEQYAMQCVSAVTVQSVTPEQGGSVNIANGTYKIISRLNGNALGAVGQGTGNLTTLNVAPYTGGNYQRWTLTSIGNGQYKLIGVASGRSINVSGNSTADGAAIILYDYQNTSNENIYFSSPSSGYYTMFFVHSNKVVDLNGANQSVAQWTSNGGNNQQWQFLAP